MGPFLISRYYKKIPYVGMGLKERYIYFMPYVGMGLQR